MFLRSTFAMIVLTVLVAAVAALGESEAERAARIAEAQRQFQEANQTAKSPEALQARVTELEAENRRLRAENAALKEKLAGEGVEPDKPPAPAAAINDKAKSIRSIEELVGLIPDMAMPQGQTKRNPGEWGQIHLEAVGNALVQVASSHRLQDMRVAVKTLPSPIRWDNSDEYYRFEVLAPVRNPKLYFDDSPNESPTEDARGLLWRVDINLVVKPQSENQRKLLLTLKKGDTLVIEGALSSKKEAGAGRPLTWQDFNVNIREMSLFDPKDPPGQVFRQRTQKHHVRSFKVFIAADVFDKAAGGR